MLPEIGRQLLIVMLGLGMGQKLGQSFHDFDKQIDGNKIRNRFLSWLVKGFLKWMHHWYFGVVLILASGCFSPDIATFVEAFGWGLILSDIKDVPDFLRAIAERIPIRISRKQG